MLSASLAAAQPGPANRLTITVVTAESGVPTLRERVGSWFSDGTEVEVGVAAALPSEDLFAAAPGELQVWVVQLSAERALVMFSNAAGRDGARYLLREVRLVSGLDELGLERLASVIHTASLALRAGIEGAERPAVEKELIEAGLLPNSAPAAPAPAPVEPSAPAPAPLLALDGPPTRALTAPPGRISFLLAAGYAARARGAEQLGHGPLLALGLQLPRSRARFLAQVSAHLLFRSEFDAGAFRASVQTNALRLHVGAEPTLAQRLRLQVLLGGGADLAQVRALAVGSPSGQELTVRAPGSQWRLALEPSVGVWWQGKLVDVGASAHATLLLGDVHYSLATADGSERLVTPWPVQPGLSLQARFRSEP